MILVYHIFLPTNEIFVGGYGLGQESTYLAMNNSKVPFFSSNSAILIKKSTCLLKHLGKNINSGGCARLCFTSVVILKVSGMLLGRYLKKNYLKKRDDEQPFRELYIKNYGVLL